MLMFLALSPRPDVPVWRARRALAALDALAWPALFAGLAVQQLSGAGVVQGVILAVCGWAAMARTRRALCNNERYRFTTWRWGKVLFALLAVALCLQITLFLAR